MTLPASGAISLFQVADEFGLPRDTAFPAGFYGKGGAPSSGALGFSDFYGRSNVTFTPDGGSVTDTQGGSVSATLLCSEAATWTYSGGGPGGSVSIISGASATSITFSVTAGATDITLGWTAHGQAGAVGRDFTLSLTALGSS